MRDAAARLVNRNRLGRDVFARGMPEPVIVQKESAFAASLYDLLTAYASQRQRRAVTNVRIAKRGVWSLKQAREILVRMIGDFGDWSLGTAEYLEVGFDVLGIRCLASSDSDKMIFSHVYSDVL